MLKETQNFHGTLSSSAIDKSVDFMMIGRTVDILFISYNRPQYTALALDKLLSTCDENMNVWVWHNGNDADTLQVVSERKDHPRVSRFHHSRDNMRLREPTNWLFRESSASYLSKVDDDCIMPNRWAETLRVTHEANANLGVLGCWRFPEEDFLPEAAGRKIRSLKGAHSIMENLWVEGSGFLMKSQCVKELGELKENQSFPAYCIELAKRGWVNGWYFPFLYQEHMDDPRSQHTLLKTDSDLQRYLPLSAKMTGVLTLADWKNQLKQSARILQEASVDVREYRGLRLLRRRVLGKLSRMMTNRRGW